MALKVGLKPNDTVSAESLLYGMLLPSGNDCAMAVAYHIGGNIENFANLMNAKATELGLEDTHFANPHGLDNDEHYSSAYSLAILAKYALSYPKIAEIVSTNEKDVNFGSLINILLIQMLFLEHTIKLLVLKQDLPMEQIDV